MSAPQPGDKSAGFSGLILGAIGIFVIVFAIVRITSAHKDKEKAEAGEKPAVVAPAAAPAAAPAP